MAIAPKEKHSSPFFARQQRLTHLGCVRCHQRDSDRSPPIESIGSTLGGASLQAVPFQRTPRLSYPLQKYERKHIHSVVKDGIQGLRTSNYTYRMPSFADEADVIVQALAEGDGESLTEVETPVRKIDDPTLGPLTGPQLVGFQGYGCVSCHVWNGKQLADPDPGAVGTDLTRVNGRIRRDWFDRYLEGPMRFHPGTPMPAIFQKGKNAQLTTVLDGDPTKQRDPLWS